MIRKRSFKAAQTVSMSICALPCTRVTTGPVERGFAHPAKANSRIQNQPTSISHGFTESFAELG